MNIAHLLPHSAQFPLKKHNGRYDWVLRLARRQAKAGHTVTIYAGPGSKDDSLIQWKSLEAIFKDATTNNIALIESAQQNKEHEILHSHFDYLHYFLANQTTKPIVVTQHWFPSETVAYASHFSTRHNVHTVPVTHFMEQENNRLGIETEQLIYHGIDLNLFTPASTKSDRFLFVGRIHPRKGVKEAVIMAHKAHIPFDIVGKINDTEQDYWDEVAPYVDGEMIRYLGPKSLKEVADLMRKAKAFLFASEYAEAFGQVTIEAQASGTPVIISNVGASRELVKDKETGFVCASEHDFVDAIRTIDSINPEACRSFAKQFDIVKMVADYDALYQRLLTK